MRPPAGKNNATADVGQDAMPMHHQELRTKERYMAAMIKPSSFARLLQLTYSSPHVSSYVFPNSSLLCPSLCPPSHPTQHPHSHLYPCPYPAGLLLLLLVLIRIGIIIIIHNTTGVTNPVAVIILIPENHEFYCLQSLSAVKFYQSLYYHYYPGTVKYKLSTLRI